MLRQEELTPEILMVLTDQDLTTFALPPEALHYGSDVTENTDSNTDLFTLSELHIAGKTLTLSYHTDLLTNTFL